MGAIANDWLVPLSAEFKKPYYASLYKKVVEEYTTHVVYPPSDEIFTAFNLTPLSKVKVVILGQDPYHEPGQAHGLSFSVKPALGEFHPSLVNIYKELHEDLGCYIPDNGYLVKWANQGVLMLNTLLTVRAHQAFSHKGIGWEQFDSLLKHLPDRIVLWCLFCVDLHTVKKTDDLQFKTSNFEPRIRVLCLAYRGFLETQAHLAVQMSTKRKWPVPIDWQIENRI